ncbi:MAG: xanthine dehydrogenase family protein molybdopterin-binding subunit [Deltaproteobacteria bacterium]|nr:xanthine dehydrogenase family protein molybdopterin-binding subunit [Deltaproteobacteria bacterium]
MRQVQQADFRSPTNQARADLEEKVTGRAKYVEDLREPPGTAFVATLVSPYSHARLISIDSSKAEKLAGVIAVLDRERLGDLNPMLHTPRYEYMMKGLRPLPDDQPLMVIDKARFDGELVAAVAAEDLRTARKAVELIEASYEPLEPVFDPAGALDASAPLLHENLGTNLLLEDKVEWGDVERGFKDANRIFEETYTSPSMFHHPMENVGGCIIQVLNDEATIWGSTDAPFRDGDKMADFFQLDRDRVRFRAPFVGGHFGAKHVTNSMFAAMFLARKTGRPMKTVPTAAESFRATARHGMVYKARIGVKGDGTLTALAVEMVVDTGAYTTGAVLATHNMVISAWGCYRIPNVRVTAKCVYTNKVPASHTRSTGKFQTTWALESLIDSVARQMGIEPIDFRRKNVLQKGEFVSQGAPHMDADFIDMMEKAAAAIKWDGRSSRGRHVDGGADPGTQPARGRALVLALRSGNFGGGRAYAMAAVDVHGRVKIQHNATEPGQGVYHLIKIIASETLEIPPAQVIVGEPDTATALPFAGVNAQRTTIQLGNAVKNACENLKQELLRVASEIRGGEVSEWRIAQGRLWRAEQSLSFGEIAASIKTLGDNSILKAIGSYSPPPSRSLFGGLDHWAASAAAVELEADPQTGEIKLIQYSMVSDAGKILHYNSAKGQLEGGAIMGISHAFFEETLYQDGQLLNADPFQYRIATMEDMPAAFKTVILENGDGPGPFGSKGISQTSITMVAPAIGNAIFDALGVRIRSVPITPENLLKGMGKI